LTPII